MATPAPESPVPASAAAGDQDPQVHGSSHGLGQHSAEESLTAAHFQEALERAVLEAPTALCQSSKGTCRVTQVTALGSARSWSRTKQGKS